MGVTPGGRGWPPDALDLYDAFVGTASQVGHARNWIVDRSCREIESMTPTAYVDGEYAPLDEAKVSVLDRGFLFGDGVYEVVRLYDGSWFRFERHLARLCDSAHAIDMEGVPTMQEFGDIVDGLESRANLHGDGYLYIQMTRGAAPRQAAYPSCEPTVVCYVDEVRRRIGSRRDEGASVVTVPDTRWQHCDIKSINLLPKVMMSEHAHQEDAYEAVFVGDNGEVFEGTSTNVFVYDRGRLRTPSDSSRVLPGITRREVVDMAAEEGMNLDFGQVLLSDAMEAEEIFLTGTLTEVLGVVSIDGMEVGGGEVGSLTRHLQQKLRARMAEGGSNG